MIATSCTSKNQIPIGQIPFSSGNSANPVNAAQRAREKKIAVAALTGFAADDALGKLSDPHLGEDSKAYNIVECTYVIWLTATCDRMIGPAEYGVKR